jgi:soluble lytic murein transglycosylase-like protein
MSNHEENHYFFLTDSLRGWYHGAVRTVLLIIAGVLCAQADADASDIYRNTTQEGVVVYSDVPQDPEAQTQRPVPPPSARKPGKHSYRSIIVSKARKYGLDASLIEAVIRVESDFNPHAVSGKGALGLMQLMPSTAEEMGVSDPLNPEQNIEGGSRYLRYLLERFEGDLTLALAAYNAGPTSVERYGSVPPIRETADYIKKIYKLYRVRRPAPRPERTVIYRLVLTDGTVMFTDARVDPSSL